MVNWRTSADPVAQSRKYLIDLIVGKKSVPGACNAMLIGAFHLEIESKYNKIFIQMFKMFGFWIQANSHDT